MGIRRSDRILAAIALLPAVPICLIAAIGIWLADGRPLLYTSRRVGLRGRRFTMYKLRTMRHGARQAGAITGDRDDRVFTVGRWLRTLKIDELPQLLNVVHGDMAIVGPRPEDPAIVEQCYGPLAWETLGVAPGLASPGSIYSTTHGERQLGSGSKSDSGSVETTYVDDLLPRKLALDLVYVRAASPGYDLRIVWRAAAVIIWRGLGRRAFPDPPELADARAIEPFLRIPRVQSAGPS
jgi:lipopolysaccharide/colanic/teichoic acid biosynthesis glycosyltransferase